MILATEQVITTTLTVISVTIKLILATEEVITATVIDIKKGLRLGPPYCY